MVVAAVAGVPVAVAGAGSAWCGRAGTGRAGKLSWASLATVPTADQESLRRILRTVLDAARQSG